MNYSGGDTNFGIVNFETRFSEFCNTLVPRSVVNYCWRESASCLALSMTVKTRPFGSLSGWDGYCFCRKPLYAVFKPSYICDLESPIGLVCCVYSIAQIKVIFELSGRLVTGSRVFCHSRCSLFFIVISFYLIGGILFGESLWVRVNRLDSITCWMARVKFLI